MRTASIIVLVLIVLAAIVQLQPDTFNVSRSASINAPASVVYSQINNFHKWENWSPWAKLDPEAEVSFEGPQSGKNAVMRWKGNGNVGEGSATIVKSQAPSLINMRLEFLKPFKGTNDVTFTFTHEGNATVVTWTMTGKNNFISKAMGLAMNCDKIVGAQFEQGLAAIKEIAESKQR